MVVQADDGEAEGGAEVSKRTKWGIEMVGWFGIGMMTCGLYKAWAPCGFTFFGFVLLACAVAAYMDK